MKKLLAFLTAAAILFACGCGMQPAPEATTEPVTAELTTAPQLDDDLALPAINESGSTTAPVVAGTTQPTTAFVQSPALKALEQAQDAPATTTTTTTTAPAADDPAATEPADQTPSETATQAPTETTTQAPKKAEMLQRAVLAPIKSGTYTMTISAFGKDHSDEDKLVKLVRGNETAYWITIPAANLTYKAFPSGDSYYLATPSKYCELTKAQYDSVCKSFNNAFCNFEALQYQKTETVRDGLKQYTCEYFDFGESPLILWYSGDSLVKLEIEGESLPMTVVSGADSAYFSLDPSLEKVDYATLESLVSLASAFFG